MLRKVLRTFFSSFARKKGLRCHIHKPWLELMLDFLEKVFNDRILMVLLKGQGHVTVNKPVISIIYIVAQTCGHCVLHRFCGGWGESTMKLRLKIHQYLCNRTTYECFVCFST